MTQRSKEDLARYYNMNAGDVTVTRASGEEVDMSLPDVTDEQKAKIEAALKSAPEDVARGARELAKAGQWPAAANWLGLDIF
ncbi:MAG TPA: hypothetical protein VM325_08975 [Alphaproteobacteria bacterium]|nr:hypothetical protein [Alphaproteobacteria bacterium]